MKNLVKIKEYLPVKIFSKKMKKNSAPVELGFFQQNDSSVFFESVDFLVILYEGSPNRVSFPNNKLTNKLNSIDNE